MMPSRASRHEESWLLLPWLASGRLSHGERLEVEEHLSECEACREELAQQRLMCRLLTEPERVTYAPGPSFRKLMDRIDGHAPAEPRAPRPALAGRGASAAPVWWRAPRLAWAASLMLAVGLATYWSQPRYVTRSDARPPSAAVLHVAFERSLPIGEMEQLLRSAGARVIEGPDASGIFGIAPAGAATRAAPSSAEARPDMRALAARMRADPRVRWVEPLAGTTGGS